MHLEHTLKSKQVKQIKQSFEDFKVFKNKMDSMPLADFFSEATVGYIGTTNQKIMSYFNGKVKAILDHDSKKPLLISPEINGDLDSLRIELLRYSENLPNKINKDLTTHLYSSHKAINEACLPILDIEDKYFDKNSEGYTKISEKHKLQTIWSMYEIPASKMTKEFINEDISEIEYDGGCGTKQSFKITKDNKPKNWVEFWKIADKLIMQSGDTHHIFIEDATYEPKTKKLKISTGS